MTWNWYKRLSPFGKAWVWFVAAVFILGGLYCTVVAFQPAPDPGMSGAELPPLEAQMRDGWRRGFLSGIDLAGTLGTLLLALVALDLLYTIIMNRPGPIRRWVDSLLRNRALGRGKANQDRRFKSESDFQ